MRLFVFVLFSCLLFACTDFEKSKQLKQVNSLHKNLDSLLIVLSQINDSQLTEEIEKNRGLISDLTMSAANDTLIETEARMLDNYANFVSRLSLLKSSLEKLKKTLEEQKGSVANLKNDIENGWGKRHLYNDQLKFEKRKRNIIERELNIIKIKKTKIINKTATFNLKTRELIQKLKSKEL
ncbi:MAG: hypothetical protein ACKO7P_10025 [Bacteroidota bacterium]